MYPSSRGEERSLVGQLLSSIGVRRRPDPFAHLTGEGAGEAGWLGSMIEECLGKGVCPICEAHRSGISDFLYWLPANLRDADYFLSLLSASGFCPVHLDAAMAYLRDFPYSQVRLFAMVRILLEEGRFATARSCYLCRALEESRLACEQALEERFAASKSAHSLTSCLCPRHARAFGRAFPAGGAMYAGERAVFPGLGKHRRDTLAKSLEEIATGFHTMETSELRRRLRACESLLREAMVPATQGPPGHAAIRT